MRESGQEQSRMSNLGLIGGDTGASIVPECPSLRQEGHVLFCVCVCVFFYQLVIG